MTVRRIVLDENEADLFEKLDFQLKAGLALAHTTVFRITFNF